jgi:hypothetical protein
MKNPVRRDTAAYYHDILEAFERSGCPICTILHNTADRYLAGVLWELVLDLETRRELNLSRGYCREHGWQLVRPGSALGVAILMKGIVSALLDDMSAPPPRSKPKPEPRRVNLNPFRGEKGLGGKQLSDTLAPAKPCPACAHLNIVEGHLVQSVVAHLRGPESLIDAYRASDGLCLSHFRQALASAKSTADIQVLSDAQRYVWQRLQGELGEFIRKNDHRFRGETFGVERDSWLRALASISGPGPAERATPPRSAAVDEGDS